MTSTLPILLQNIEVYYNNEFVGYVYKIVPRGAVVACYVKPYKTEFTTQRAKTVRSSASTSTVCYVEGKGTFYPRKDNMKFRMVLAE